MSLGIMFFFLSVLSIAFYQTNNLIISHYLGPEEVTVYNIAYRYINVLPMVPAGASVESPILEMDN